MSLGCQIKKSLRHFTEELTTPLGGTLKVLQTSTKIRLEEVDSRCPWVAKLRSP